MISKSNLTHHFQKNFDCLSERMVQQEQLNGRLNWGFTSSNTAHFSDRNSSYSASRHPKWTTQCEVVEKNPTHVVEYAMNLDSNPAPEVSFLIEPMPTWNGRLVQIPKRLDLLRFFSKVLNQDSHTQKEGGCSVRATELNWSDCASSSTSMTSFTKRS